MPDATLGRNPTAHVDAVLGNDSPDARLDRDRTGGVTARITADEQGT